MTLDKERLHTEQAASSPGVLFSALSRIRHPDTLMLNDSFPSFAQIMKGRTSKSFQMRQAWERKARAKFSRTLRRHMRDATVYTPSKVWTQEQSDLADFLLKDYEINPSRDLDNHPAEFVAHHSEQDLDTVTEVWKKMQIFPHCF